MNKIFRRRVRDRIVVFLFACCLLGLAPRLAAGETLRILFLTDIHVTPGGPHQRAMENIVEEIRAEKDSYDFAVTTGDLSNQGSETELLLAKQLLDRMDLTCYAIPGNHETCWSDSACLLFPKLWGADRFEFKYRDFYCIGINTGPFMKMGNGLVKTEDLHWLRTKLAENAADPKTKVLFFSHYPLSDAFDLMNWGEVVAVLRKHNVVAAFCGHGHRLLRFNYDSIPGFMGRPLLFKYDEPPGYNVIEIEGDRLSLLTRQLGKSTGDVFASFTLGDPKAVEGIEPEIYQFELGGDLPENVNMTLVRQDKASVFGGVAVRDNGITYGNSLGELRLCEVSNDPGGRPVIRDLWKEPLGESIYSTPILAEDRLIVGSSSNELIAFDRSDTRRLWTLRTSAPVTNDMTLLGKMLYAGLGRDEFCRIDIETGEKQWSYHGVDGRFQAAPAVGYGIVAFGAWNRTLYALDEKTSQALWTWNGGRPGPLHSPGNVIPVISPSQVVIVAPDRFMTALDRKTGNLLWRDNSFTVRESTGSSPDGRIIYAKTMNGHVIAVSAESPQFRLLWDCDTGVEYDHTACPLLLCGKTLFHGSPRGIVTAIDVKKGKKLWSYKAGHSAVNRFSVDDKHRVWFSLVEGKIYCAEIP